MPAPKRDQDKPAPVSLNLDALDRENPAEPFAIVHGGHRYVLVDPYELDWSELMQILQNPAVFFNATITAEELPKFQKTKLPGWKLKALIDGYVEHFGITSPGEALALPQQ